MNSFENSFVDRWWLTTPSIAIVSSHITSTHVLAKEGREDIEIGGDPGREDSYSPWTDMSQYAAVY